MSLHVYTAAGFKGWGRKGRGEQAVRRVACSSCRNKYLAGVGGHSWSIKKLAVQRLRGHQPQLEGLLCLLCWQDLNVAIVDELQHGAEKAAHLGLACLLGNHLETYRLCLPQVTWVDWLERAYALGTPSELLYVMSYI